MAKAFRRKGDRFVARLDPVEREVVLGLMEQTREFIAPVVAEPTGDAFTDLVATMGVPRLDEMLGGGLPRGYSLLVAGPSGSGKSILAASFLAEGARCGETGVIAAFDAPAGAYNLSDDLPCSQNAVVEYAAALLGVAPPPFVPVESLSPMARGFHAENRRVANAKAKRVLGWRPIYPDYRFGLRALSAMTSPTPASAAPAPASRDQR